MAKGNYVDGFVIVIPKKNGAKYKKMATEGAKMWKKFGALDYKETMIDDAKPDTGGAPAGRTFVNESQAVTPPPATPEPMVANGCAVAGCSGQLCVSAAEAADIVTTCEYKAEYACYREASCEPQAKGKCGWTQTTELKQYIAYAKKIPAPEAIY